MGLWDKLISKALNMCLKCSQTSAEISLIAADTNMLVNDYLVAVIWFSA